MKKTIIIVGALLAASAVVLFLFLGGRHKKPQPVIPQDAKPQAAPEPKAQTDPIPAKEPDRNVTVNAAQATKDVLVKPEAPQRLQVATKTAVSI